MTDSRTNLSPVSELAIDLDRRPGHALHRQIEASLRARIRSGALPAGIALPPTRALAAELGVSRGVVVEAYAQLGAEGYLVSRSGGYTQVASAAAAATAAAPATAVRPEPPSPSRPGRSRQPLRAIDFGYGRGDLSAFPRAAWLRSVRRVLTETPDQRLGYLDGKGAVELRSALAAYLNRVRGTNADPERIVITGGYAQAVSLLIGVLAARGATKLAVEDPSANDDARPLAAAVGIELVGVPVGKDGVRVDAVHELEADVLILTPSHQWPIGGVLSPDARASVLAWAQRTGSLVLEDDYDAEYRYDRAPVGAMQGLDPERVAYAGTASKTLAPGFRLGWIVLPSELVEPFAEAKLLADRGSPILDQLTFADFLTRGEFDRHLRRMRPRYRSRRDALLAALTRQLPELEPAGIAAGLHLVAWLPGDLDEPAVIEAAAREGVAVAGVSPYRLSPSPRGGLIFGYSNLSERAIAEGVRRLRRAVSTVRDGEPPPLNKALARRPRSRAAARYGSTAKALAIVLALAAALAVGAVPSAARDARATTLGGLRLVRGGAAALHKLTDQRRIRVVAPATRSGPVASVANVNTAVPKFQFFFNYNVVHRGKLRITAQFINPFFPSFEQIDGGCVGCTGRGKFLPFTVKHKTWRENVRGKLYMTTKTKIVQAIFSPGEIGRFTVYGLTSRQTVAPVRLAEGCIPADLELSFSQLRDYKTMPTVPCQEQLPAGDSIQLGAPIELSATSGSSVTVSGHAGEREWLTVFQAPLDSKSPCAVNALSEQLRTPNFTSAPVSGDFSGKFNAATASKPGYLCAYLQSGGRIKVKSGAVLPDGRVSATTKSFFLAGDVVTISGPTTTTAGQMFTETFSGIAQAPEQLYVFAPNSPCATTAQAEYGVDPHDFTTAEKAGAFNTPVTITISTTPPPVQYVCAYLQYGPPSNGLPSGPTLAADTTAITIG